MTVETDDEEPISRFRRWFRQRPNSIEFWELVLTDERLVWCFVGESYRSLLLRADMGERDRAIVDESPLEDLTSLAAENFAVPLESLEGIRLVTGTRFRRARLEVRWHAGDEDGEAARYDGDVTLASTGEAQSHRETVAELAADPRLEHVDVTVDAPRFPRL